MKKLVTLLLLCISAVASAETVHIIVPWSAGGINDRAARLMAKNLSEQMPNHVFVVENHPSANGIIGNRLVSNNTKKETVLLVATTMGIIYHLQQPGEDRLTEGLLPVVYLGNVQQALVANKKNPIANIAELRTSSKNPIFYGSSVGIGSANYIAGQILVKQLKQEVIQVPYKGEADSITAVLGDSVDVIFATAATVASYADKANILGVTGKNRFPMLPAVPTLTQAGLQDFENPLLKLIVLANSTANPALIKDIQLAMINVYTDLTQKEKYTTIGVDADTKALLEAEKFFTDEVPRLQKLLDKLNIK